MKSLRPKRHPLLLTIAFTGRLSLLCGALLFFPNAAQSTTETTTTPPSSEVRRFSLVELIQHVRHRYPGVNAAEHALEAARHQLTAAQWAFLPKADLTALVAPALELSCFDATGARSPENCVRTDSAELNLFKIAGVFARVELEVAMPLYTFGKLAADQLLQEAGVAAQEAELARTRDAIEMKVAEAYWGLKLARELLYEIKNGRKYLDKAIEKIDRELDEGVGESTVTDLLRLKTVAAEIDGRTAQAQKLERISLQSLALVVGQPEDRFDVDKTILREFAEEPAPIDLYVRIALQHHPDVKQHAQLVRAAQAASERASAAFYPDLLLVSTVGYGRATSADDPQNAFFNDPFNFFRAGIGLALRWQFDPMGQYAGYKQSQAEARRAQAERETAKLETEMRVRSLYEELIEAKQQLSVTKQGQKAARSWLVAASQNLELGIANARELNDALVGFFQLKAKFLKAQFDVNVSWAKLVQATGGFARQSLYDELTTQSRN